MDAPHDGETFHGVASRPALTGLAMNAPPPCARTVYFLVVRLNNRIMFSAVAPSQAPFGTALTGLAFLGRR